MSKYIKQDDIFELVRTGVLVSNSNFESVCKHIGSLPTIEVSDKADRPFEYFEGYEDGRASAKACEDAISREWLKKWMFTEWDGSQLTAFKMTDFAPSVLPKRSCYRCGLREDCEDSTERKPKEGEWQITDAYPHNVYCSECHKRFAQTHWEVWEDGSLPRNYCPNCGAKMRDDNVETD